MKAIAKRLARSLGYEISKIQSPSAWPPPDSEPPEDEVIPGPWIYHVLQMANQHYQPRTLRYHRTKYGDDQRIKMHCVFPRSEGAAHLGNWPAGRTPQRAIGEDGCPRERCYREP